VVRARHDHLSVRHDGEQTIEEFLAAFGVEGSEHVVKHDDRWRPVLVGDGLMGGHAQGEAERLLLAVRTLSAGGEVVEFDNHVVAVRTNSARAATKVVIA
jgi:hypothetical protein